MLKRIVFAIAAVCFVILIFSSAHSLFGQGLPAPIFRQQFFNNSGAVCNGCTLTTSLTGTSTPASVYSDSALMTAFSQPITLNSSGRPTTNGSTEAGIFLDPAVTYRFVLKTSAGVTIWTQDGVRVSPSTSFTGTSGCIAKFTSTGTSLQDSIICESGTTATVTGNLTVTGTITGGSLSASRTRRVPDVVQEFVVSSGTPTTVVIGTAVTVVSLSSGTASAISTGFKVPVDVVATQPLTLTLAYSVDTNPGVTNNKVKLIGTCVVNGTSAAPSAGDTITLANNTTPASYTATVNICALSSFAAGDDVVYVLQRDVTVANNAVVSFYLRHIGFIYTSTQGLADLPRSLWDWLLFILLLGLMARQRRRWSC